MSHYIYAIAAAVLLTGCTHIPPNTACTSINILQEDAIIRVPFEIVHGRVYVKARVNGGNLYTFAVDTGASGMGRADTSLTKELNLPITRQTETSDGINTATVDMTRLESLELGGFMRKNVDVITRNYSSGAPPGAAISGIIGREYFADGLLVIDFPARTLSFSKTRQLAADDKGVLAYENAFRVPVSVGDITVQGNIDTGANITLVLPKSLYEQVAASLLEAAGQGRLTNTVIETKRATIRGPVRIGGLSVSNVEVRVSDRFPELLVGGKILQNATVAIDQRSKRVAICPARGQ